MAVAATIIFFRFIFTFLLSFAFGLERQMSHKPVGFGTFIFVATGSCGVALLTQVIPTDNPFSILGAVITGIGFLGAGALLRSGSGDKISGFTTASSIWIFAIIGILIGMGQYELALLAYAFVWVVVFSDKYMEYKGIGTYRSKITIHSKRILTKKEIESALGARINRLEVSELDKEKNTYMATYFFEGTKKKLEAIPSSIMKKDWFISIKIEPYGLR
jgi:putative Mg2+ transporter-C (MgtC) family protein